MPRVNPFEETRQAAQDWSPREQYISRSNQDRTQDASINRFIREGQGNQQRWEQGGGQGAYPVFNEPGTGANFPVSPGWLQAKNDSGINLLEKGRNIYDKFKGFNIGRDGIGYKKDFGMPWGGTGSIEGYGGGDDYGGGINFSWPLGQTSSLDTGIGGTDEYQMAELTPEQQEWMRSIGATPDFISPDYSYKHIQDMEDKGFFGWGAQEPTTREEFDEYYNYLLDNPSLTSWQT